MNHCQWLPKMVSSPTQLQSDYLSADISRLFARSHGTRIRQSNGEWEIDACEICIARRTPTTHNSNGERVQVLLLTWRWR